MSARIISLTVGCIVCFYSSVLIETTPPLAERFARFIARLCAVIGVYGAVFPWSRPLVAAAQARVRRLGERFASLCARASAGKFHARRRGAARGPDVAARERPAILPATLRWLMQAVGAAFHCAEPLKRLLDDPAMAELVATAPQAGTILRPLCRMVGVKRPAYLRAARRAAAPAEAPLAGGEQTPDPGPQANLPAPVVVPSPPARSKAEEEALAYARRPGGFYFDGKGLRWS